ncbi:MAG: TIGR01777 family oxidoreductase [Flavobacteriaceae bacterium]|jgi:uncharacterized protein (TIGR01777 family)|nr:TIGR01777 family oxidoreductase [Flavobacteriaceae bacterium]
MKLLITGATGLIGKKITENLLETGFQIHYLTTGKSKTNILQGATGFYWNPEQNQIDLKCFYGVDTIIHLAGSTVSKRWTKSYKEKIYSSRINSSKLLLKGIEDLNGEHQIKHLVSASAIGVYPSDFNDYFDEEAEVSRTTFMERVVIDWENETDSFSSEGISIAKLRIGLVLSESGGVLGTLKLPTYFGLGAAFGSGKQGQSWIHMNDLVGIFLKAVEDQWEGVFNAVAPNPVTQSEFIASLSRALKRPYFLPPIPAFLIRIGAGEMSDLVLDSHWISSQKVIDKGYSFQYTDIQKALDDLIK